MRTHGRLRSGPSLVIGNHVSFLDVLVLAAAAPMRMVAEREICQWPVIGRLARRTGTLFMDRAALRELPAVVAEATGALRSGYRVQVFPEAATRCCEALNPFHQAAFQAALDAAVVISPVSLRYRNGPEATSPAAFVGTNGLWSALRRVIAAGELTVEVHWLRPIPAIAGTGRSAADRRIVARLTENAIARDLGDRCLAPRRGLSRSPVDQSGRNRVALR